MDRMTENYIEPKYIASSLDLDKYVQLGSTTESMYLDFKLEIEISSLTNKKKQDTAEEFALDICQFANTWGGVLLIGVREAVGAVAGKKVAKEFPGVTNFEELNQFIHDSVLRLIHPKDIKIDLVCFESSLHTQVIAVNVFPLAIGVACVCDPSPPYSPRFPYRTHYGKQYLHPIEVENRMSSSNRSVPIKLEDLCRRTREVTVYPKVVKEPIDKPEKWDSPDMTVFLKQISSYEFSLRISGVDVNIPFSLVRDVWFTEKETIGILLNTRLVMASDRRSINLDL